MFSVVPERRSVPGTRLTRVVRSETYSKTPRPNSSIAFFRDERNSNIHERPGEQLSAETNTPGPLINGEEFATVEEDTTGHLYSSWKEWADASQEFLGSKKRFSQKLEERGFEPAWVSRVRGFRGLEAR